MVLCLRDNVLTVVYIRDNSFDFLHPSVKGSGAYFLDNSSDLVSLQHKGLTDHFFKMTARYVRDNNHCSPLFAR